MSHATETTTVPSTSLDDLDLDAFDRYLRRHAPRLAAEDVPHEEALLRLRLAGAMGSRIVPTVAGLYIFGHEPQFALPNLGLVAARFEGDEITDEVRARSDCHGSLVVLVEATLDFVRKHSRELVNQLHPASSTHEFPITAVNEALVNALVHRDLRSPGRVAVRIFDDRLEVWSPGAPNGLPDAIDTYVVRGGVSLPRNPLTAVLARQLGLAEQLGRGLPTMRRAIARETKGELLVRGTKDGVIVAIPSAIQAAARLTTFLDAN